MKHLGFLLGWTLLAVISRGQLTFNSLEQLLQYADQKSLVAEQGRLQTGISRQDEVINKSSLLPKLNLFGTADYYPIITSQLIPEALFGGSPDKFRKVQFGLPWSLTSGLELSFPAINPEKWDQYRRYKLQSLQTQWNAQAALENLHIQLTQAYYQALLARELWQFNLANQAVGDELFRVMEARKGNGQLNPADFNRTRNLQLDLKTAGVEYERNFLQALVNIKSLANLPDSLDLLLTDSISAHGWPGAPVAKLVTERPGFKESEAKIAVAAMQLRETRKAALPKISFNSKYTYAWQMKPSEGTHLNYDYSNIGLRLDFPLFQGNFYKASRRKNEMQLELARTSGRQTLHDLNRQQAEWWNDFNAAGKKQVLLAQKVELAADNLRIARLSVREGVMEFEEFNNIFQEYNKAKTDYLQNLNDALVYQLLLTIK